MFATFFSLAARSPSRQRVIRRAFLAHVLVVSALVFLLPLTPRGGLPLTLLGQFLLVAGIVEGAILVGWRLTQLPKSQALEFLLVSPVRPHRILLAEASVGITILALVTLSGAPILGLLVASGILLPIDLWPLLLIPLTWGALTGLILTTWAYEPLRVRCWGERIMMFLILVYLVAGVLAAEKLHQWLQGLPEDIGYPLFRGLIAFRDYNPFGAMRYWTEKGPDLALERTIGMEVGSLVLLALLLARAASRLERHFHERHYQPAIARRAEETDRIADRPLTWWAVKRVSEYSGRINIWLAGGFCLLYCAYSLAGSHYPAWMGRTIFALCDRTLGLTGLATVLVVLAAVPAAFQYGLWDASVQDRCRRLELLLLTRLKARDYWHAAASAAWKRGRGYFVVAVLLWTTALISGNAEAGRVLAALASGVLLWSLYFAIGFNSFSRGTHANGLGVLLTVGIPLAVIGLYRMGWPIAGSLLPPGGVYGTTALVGSAWVFGPVLAALLALVVARRSLQLCDERLRRWYDLHHGQKVMT